MEIVKRLRFAIILSKEFTCDEILAFFAKYHGVGMSIANIVTYYLDAVEHQGECSQKLITDLGTENWLNGSIHSHCYVPSLRNQRSEAWWFYF